ncbi:DNA primase [Pedosphaera parvula]|uniref:DNA primase n=1 Tax=Pedosphaera parvula (strain Ellin514) TaxID=320771 RepID=B9XFW4_PEDPL|nr:DNA primase [Pedosphaera parvula]EEF61126.1 DNA primase [Pedosphaera parvula Ellin514]
MTGFFSQATREQVRSASDIVDVIGSYLPLKRAGANFVALCPFHKEKSPSFNVNPHKQIFHCFGCHKGGDVFTFVKEYENIPFPDAVKRLAERAKIPLEMDNNPAQQQSRHLKDVLLQIHEQITQRWQSALANEAAGQIARDYLVQRGVTEEAIKLFRLGYAPDVWEDTVNWSRSKGFDPVVMEQSGLILRKEGSDHYYDRFRGRLIFPICDEQGRVIGFSGRVLSGDQKTAKYVNSPETPIFTKGKVFFGLDKSKRALLEAQSAIVCEGQLDLIACYMAGVQNMVAPQGTALTADHARILKRYAEEVVLCFDSDNAGQNAAVRSLDSLLASGLAIRVAVVPAPHDPDSFIKEYGGEAFKELVKKASGFFDYYLNRLCETNDVASDKGRLIILQEMAEAVYKTGNVVLIDTYAQKTAFRLGVPPEAVRAEFRKASRSKNATPLEVEEAIEIKPSKVPLNTPEHWFLKLIFLQEEGMDWIHAHLDPNWIQHLTVRQIAVMRLAVHAQGTWQGVATFLNDCESEEMRSLITEASSEERPIPNPTQQMNDIVLRLRNQFIERQMAVLAQESGKPGLGDEERLAILVQQQKLRQLKRQPLTPLAEPEGPF